MPRRSTPQSIGGSEDAAADVRSLLFLSQLFSRAADVLTGSIHLGKPLGMVAAVREVLRGKLARAQIAPSDLEAAPMLLVWLGMELLRVVT